MTDSLRLRFLKNLTAAFQEITVGAGYQHDLSESVFRGRIAYGDNDPVPMVSILEPPLAPNQIPSNGNNTANAGDYELLIQGFVQDDKRNPTDPAYLLLADVKKRLALEKKKIGEVSNAFGMGELITKIDIGLGVVRPPDAEVSAKAYFWLLVTVGFLDDMEDPLVS